MINQKSVGSTMTMAEALSFFQSKYDGPPTVKARLINDTKAAFRLHPALPGLAANGTAIRFTLAKLAGTKRGVNIRSSLRALLRFIAGQVPGAKRVGQMADEARVLVEQMKAEKCVYFQLQRLLRYCGENNISVHAISDQIVADFLQSIEALGTVKDTRKFHGRLVRAWNKAREIVPGWPNRQLTLPPLSGEKLTPALHELPSALAVEHCKCEQALLGEAEPDAPRVKRFDRKAKRSDRKQRKAMRQNSATSYMKYIRRALKMAARLKGTSLDDLSFSVLRDPEMAENILGDLSEELEGNGKGDRALHLMACALARVAETYFKVTAEDLKEFHVLLNQIETPEPKMTLKNVKRLRTLVIKVRHELVRLPAVLLNNTIRVIKLGRCQSWHLTDAKVAVAIAIELSIPLREANLAAIRFGVHLTLPPKRGTEGRLRIPAAATKNNVEIDRPIPTDLAELLRIYQTNVLPLLRSNPESDALFPGRSDSSTQGPANLGTKVSERIEKHLGIDMHLHLFRHFAGMLYLEAFPGEYEVVRLLLGNRNLAIVKAYYLGMESEAAFRKAGRAIQAVKHDAGLDPTNMLVIKSDAKRRPRHWSLPRD